MLELGVLLLPSAGMTVSHRETESESKLEEALEG